MTGPVVDPGPCALVIAKALPEAEIIAVEPSSGLRAVLLSTTTLWPLRTHGRDDVHGRAGSAAGR